MDSVRAQSIDGAVAHSDSETRVTPTTESVSSDFLVRCIWMVGGALSGLFWRELWQLGRRLAHLVLGVS